MSVVKSNICEMMHEAGEGWIVEIFDNTAEAGSYFNDLLTQLNLTADKHLGRHVLNLDEQTLVGEYNKNPHRVKAFFQAMGASANPLMLLMVWRVLQGMEIYSAEVSYKKLDAFSLKVVLISPYGEMDKEYTSNSIQDFMLLGHFGCMTIDSQPLLIGFDPS